MVVVPALALVVPEALNDNHVRLGDEKSKEPTEKLKKCWASTEQW